MIRGEPIPDIEIKAGDRDASATDGTAASTERQPRAPAAIDGWNSETTATDQQPQPDSGDGDLRLTQKAADAAYARGDIATAQRLYERMIGDAPDAPEATHARKRLGAIYRGEAPKADPVLAEGTKPAALAQPAIARGADAKTTTGALDDRTQSAPPAVGSPTVTAPATAATTNVAEPAPRAWRPRARRTHRFEDLMRADVGDRIFFGVASAEVGSRARSVIERQAEWLARYPDLYIVLEGHADEPGDDSINDAMALRRARTAFERLVAAGVPAERMDVDVRGNRDRAVVCEEATCRSQNHRVVVRLMLVLPTGTPPRSSHDDRGPVSGRLAQDADTQHELGKGRPRR